MDLPVSDISFINTKCKSYLYQDMLQKSSELVLFRPGWGSSASSARPWPSSSPSSCKRPPTPATSPGGVGDHGGGRGGQEDGQAVQGGGASAWGGLGNWGRSYSLARLKGLSPDHKSVLFKLLHQLLPTGERVHRLQPNKSPACTLCRTGPVDTLLHACTECEANNAAGARECMLRHSPPPACYNWR